MNYDLCFDPAAYEVRQTELEGVSARYRAFKGIPYCAAPVDPIQKLNLYVPEDYYAGAQHNGYTLHTAPIFLPNTVGGYLPGPADCPGPDRFGRPNATLCALAHGYVVACIGVRGRTSGHRNTEFFEGSKAAESEAETGRSVGKAPAFVVDRKAGCGTTRHSCPVTRNVSLPTVPVQAVRCRRWLVPAGTARNMPQNWLRSVHWKNETMSLLPTASAPSTIWKMRIRPTNGCSAAMMISAPCV